MTDVNTDKLLEGIKAHFATPEIIKLVEDIQEGGLLHKLAVGIGLVVEGVKAVEQIAADLGDMSIAGSQKKAALVKFLDDVIELPFYAEPFDGPVLSLAIDGIVAYYNVKIGHGWLGVMRDFLG